MSGSRGTGNKSRGGRDFWVVTEELVVKRLTEEAQGEKLVIA